MLIRLDIDCDEGMVTDETVAEVYIEHPKLSGWMEKTEFWERLGKDSIGHYLA